MGRVLVFPVPTDPLGQYELFPEPDPPDRHSASQLVIQYTLLQIRVTRISTYLSPERRMFYFGQLNSLLNAVERDELHIATLAKIRQEVQQARIA